MGRFVVSALLDSAVAPLSAPARPAGGSARAGGRGLRHESRRASGSARASCGDALPRPRPCLRPPGSRGGIRRWAGGRSSHGRASNGLTDRLADRVGEPNEAKVRARGQLRFLIPLNRLRRRRGSRSRPRTPWTCGPAWLSASRPCPQRGRLRSARLASLGATQWFRCK